jgi:hypothetical protein
MHRFILPEIAKFDKEEPDLEFGLALGCFLPTGV